MSTAGDRGPWPGPDTPSRPGLSRHLLFVFIAGVATLINLPLGRFAGQDLIWNDLMLLNRVAWLGDALRHDPLASVDFLQGLGSQVRSDVKVIPHFYEPAVFLGLLADPLGALVWRNLLLVLYCLYCLDRLYRIRPPPGAAAHGEPLRLPLLLGYVLAPQLMFDVGHHFGAVFYAAPGFLLALRQLALRPAVRSGLAFVGAATLLVHLSDLHIAFLAPTLVAFAWMCDPEIRRAPWAVVIGAAGAFAAIIACSYLQVARVLAHVDPSVVANAGTWTLQEYLKYFIRPVTGTFLVPAFTGPICLYVAPFVPFLLLPLFSRRTRGPAARRLGWLALTVALLFALGLVLHGVGPLRARLPSAMRYHLAVVPFLACLLLAYSRAEIEAVLAARPWRWTAWALLGAGVLAQGWAVSAGFTPNPYGFVAIGGWLFDLGGGTERTVGLALLWAFPWIAFAWSVAAPRARADRPLGALLGAALALLWAGAFCATRASGLSIQHFGYVDRSLRQKLYERLPAEIDRLIRNGPYAGATRSVVPVARSSHDPARGINDKLLPLIEYPESIHARSFFQWRYSYSAQTSALYSAATGWGTVCFFPPTPAHLDQVLAFARLTDSPFILAADEELSSPDLEKLGSVAVADAIIARGTLNNGLTGVVHVYALRSFRDGSGAAATPHAAYSRTRAVFRGLAPGARLPITYFSSLRARDQDGRAVALAKGDDGFARVAGPGAPSVLTVTSFSPWAIGSPLAPVAGWLVLLASLRLGRRLAERRARFPLAAAAAPAAVLP